MAGMPPGPGAPGLPPGGPPPGAGGMPPQGPPMPPMGPPGGAPPPPPPMQNPGMQAIYTDLSVDMSHGWQMIEMGIRCLRTALKMPEFQKTDQAAVGTVVREVSKTLNKLLAHYISGKRGVSSMGGSSTTEDDSADSRSAFSSDADTMPEADTESDS